MSDFSVTVGGDFSELLSGFKQVERTAAASGQAAGQALGGGIQGATQRSIDALLADLGRLKAQKASISVDGSQVSGLTKQITAVQKQIDTLRATRVAIQADPRTLDGLSQKLSSLQSELGKVEIGSKRFKELQTAIASTEKELTKATQTGNFFTNALGKVGGGLAALGVGLSLGTFIKSAFDASVAAESARVRIKALGDQFGEADRVQQVVARSAKLLNLSTSEASDGFLQLYGALRPTGISLTDIETVFTATNAAAKNFGLSAASVQSAVLQLSQGLAAGTLQGDELRSIMEQMPPVAQAIAKEMGITVGQVKKFGSEGKITSDVVIRAIKGMNEVELGKLNATMNTTAEKLKSFGNAWENLQVALGEGFKAAALPIVIALTGGLENLAKAAQLVPAALQSIGRDIAAFGGLGRIIEGLINPVGALAKSVLSIGLELARLIPGFSGAEQAATSAFGGMASAIGGALTSAKTLVSIIGGAAGFIVTIAIIEGVAKAFIAVQQGIKIATMGAALFQAVLNPAALAKVIAGLAIGGIVAGKIGEEFDKSAAAAAASTAATNAQTGALAAQAPAAATLAKTAEERAKVEAEINKILEQAPIRNLEAQLAVGQQLLGLSKAVGDLEQSRFSVAKAGLQFELKALQDRGAGESVIAAKKAEIDQADRAALSARYQALTQQQALEQAMLQLSQEKARTESNLEIMNQKSKILEKQGELLKASSAEEKANIQAQINLQQANLGVLEEKAGTLAKTQPLERAIAAATAETARNGLQAEAAAQGFRIAADGSLVKTQGLANSIKNVAVYAGNSATEQERYRRIAEQSGLAIGKAADGSVVLGRTQQEVNKAVEEMNKQLGGAKGGYDNAGKAAGGTKTATQEIEKALKDAGIKADGLSKGIGDGAKSAGTAKTAADGLGKSLDAGKNPAGAIASAFTSTGKAAPAAAQGARDFAAYLSSAKTFAEKIASLNLGDRMASVRDATRDAATQARTFYDWLLKASGLPGSRWSGGPVDAGEAYKVNELGQEALLSAGRLSLIQAPANSIWRAPSSGVVIPAGITARLQDAGALPGPGGITSAGGNAELAIEIGKLRQEVGELARKQWNISVTQRTGPTGSQVLRTLQQLR